MNTPALRFFSYREIEAWEDQGFLRWQQNSMYYTGSQTLILWPDTGREPGTADFYRIVGEDTDGVICRREDSDNG